jgi:NAD(P)-dependent dehydrogenase (short-subunit alcohol dehydrogenase family)
MTEQNKSRVVLLTGAAGGLGSVMSKALLDAGHSVAAVDRSGAGLEKLAAALQAGDRFLPITAELSDSAQCDGVVARAVAHFGRLEGIINNAGIGMSEIRPDAEKNHPGLEELSAEIWDRFFAVNARAPMSIARAGLPHMRKAGWGRIVNNTTSYRTMLRVLPYGAVKAALESMSAVWADELKDTGVTVNVLVPGGPTDTPFISDAAGWSRDEMLKPRIMAAPAVWLMSDESNGFTGQRITAAEWDTSLPPAEAARKASRGIGWPELAAQTAWWPKGNP